MALIQHWKLDDNAASTTIVATVGNNGALIGGDNTSAKFATGPGTQATGAQHLNGTDDAIDVSAASISFASGVPFSIGTYFNLDTGTAYRMWGRTDGFQSFIAANDATTVLVNLNGVTSSFTVPNMGTGTWHHLLVTKTAGDSVRAFLNGSESSTGPLTNANAFAPTHIGLLTTQFHDGLLSWAKVWNTDESANAVAIAAEEDLPAVGGLPTFKRSARRGYSTLARM
jgi:hypothetical protein